MTNFEMVEQLRQKADVSYEEAKEALEKTNWDLLDAMLLLEKEGRIKANTASYSTREKSAPEEEKHASRFFETLGRIGRQLAKILQRGNVNLFEVSRKDEVILTVPVTVLVLLIIFMFWITLPLLIIGLFTGFHYAFRGPDLEKDVINGAFDKAEGFADKVKEDMQKEHTED